MGSLLALLASPHRVPEGPQARPRPHRWGALLYTWTDAEGTVHLGEEPPPKGTRAKKTTTSSPTRRP